MLLSFCTDPHSLDCSEASFKSEMSWSQSPLGGGGAMWRGPQGIRTLRSVGKDTEHHFLPQPQAAVLAQPLHLCDNPGQMTSSLLLQMSHLKGSDNHEGLS